MTAGASPSFVVIRAFETVGRMGGIRKAASVLGVSHAIVSRHMVTLEEFAGQALFNRRTGELTDAGKRYHARISAAIAEMEAATSALRGDQAGSLTIWCSPGFSLLWLARRLPEFQAREPAAPLFDLRSTDSEPALPHGEADGDIRYLWDDQASSLPSGVRAEEIARPAVFPVASPRLAAAAGGLLSQPADILRLPLIEEASNTEWSRWLAGQGFAAQSARPPVARYGQAHLALAAARAGQGVALANSFLVADDLASGRLVRVVAKAKPWAQLDLGAYYFRCSRARWSDPWIARFRKWLHQAVANDEQGVGVGDLPFPLVG